MHATESGDTLLLHHFDDIQQQKDSSTLGMWAFLATEVMFFGGLFAAYSVYRMLYPVEFARASSHLNIPLGAINTAVLLCSSLTMALAVHAAQLRRSRRVVQYLIATMVLGTAFLGIKASEWYADYKDGLIPGVHFDWERAEAEHGRKHEGDEKQPNVETTSTRKSIEPQVGPGKETNSAVPSGKAQLFFLLYFLMTGLHAFHMIVGIVLVGIIARYCHIGWFSGGGETQVEVTGLYWHFIDVVWVFLYPLLYLI